MAVSANAQFIPAKKVLQLVSQITTIIYLRITKPINPFQHMSPKQAFSFLAVFFHIAFVLGQEEGITVPTPVKVALFDAYTEGIVFDAAGNAYISVLHKDTVWKLGFPGKPEFWFSAKTPNGHKIRADGSHLLATAGAVLHISPEGLLIDTVSRGIAGMDFRLPNDLTLDKFGGFYLTDPGDGDDTKNRQGRIYYVDSMGNTSLAAMNLAYPNGIVLRPDGKTLLVAESGTFQILQYDVAGAGKIKLSGVFAPLDGTPGDQFADGMCLDAEGNVYVAIYQGGMVQRVDLEGNVDLYIPTGLLTTSNVAFGGKENNALFVTGGIRDEDGKGGLMTIRLDGVRGLPVIPTRE